MAEKIIVEPFTNINLPGRYGIAGTPCLTIVKRHNDCDVKWSDGNLYDYKGFQRILHERGLTEKLKGLFNEHASICSHNAFMIRGAANGCFMNAPVMLAEQVFELVRSYFNDALQKLEEQQAAISTMSESMPKKSRLGTAKHRNSIGKMRR